MTVSTDAASKPVPGKVSTLMPNQQLKLSCLFSGQVGVKGEATFDLWKYEVECLVKDKVYSEETIRRLIRTSHRGEAAHVLKRLGPQASVEIILNKFTAAYGIVETGEETVAEFYSACQRDTEDVSAWSCRLEDLLNRRWTQR